MNILIDNKNLYSHFGIKILDYTPALAIAKEREDIQTWYNKSGIDKNLSHNRFEAKEFVMECYTKQVSLEQAYLVFRNFAQYLHTQKVVVMSLHSSDMRQAFLVERSQAIVPDINVRQQNTLYYCKIGFRDINPNALVYYKTLTAGTTTLSIDYDKGLSANVFWGNGDRGEVSNSTTYTHNTYISGTTNQLIDIIVDVDKDLEIVNNLNADFISDSISGISNHTVQFTSTSTGNPVKWRWDFGDTEISDLESPVHIYKKAGVYTVELTIYNSKDTSASKEVIGYMTIRQPRLLFLAGNNNIIYSTPTNYIVTQP